MLHLARSEQLGAIAALPDSEKRLAASLVRRNAFELSQALAPLLGPKMANLIFGVSVYLAMGFSTIVILMLINGYAFLRNWWVLPKEERHTWLAVLSRVWQGLVGHFFGTDRQNFGWPF